MQVHSYSNCKIQSLKYITKIQFRWKGPWEKNKGEHKTLKHKTFNIKCKTFNMKHKTFNIEHKYLPQLVIQCWWWVFVLNERHFQWAESQGAVLLVTHFLSWCTACMAGIEMCDYSFTTDVSTWSQLYLKLCIKFCAMLC